MPLSVAINGQPRTFAELMTPVTLSELVDQLQIKADRVAVELNGEIAPRSHWRQTAVATGDRLEIVHFVGGGTGQFIGGSRRIETASSQAW